MKSGIILNEWLLVINSLWILNNIFEKPYPAYCELLWHQYARVWPTLYVDMIVLKLFYENVVRWVLKSYNMYEAYACCRNYQSKMHDVSYRVNASYSWILFSMVNSWDRQFMVILIRSMQIRVVIDHNKQQLCLFQTTMPWL